MIPAFHAKSPVFDSRVGSPRIFKIDFHQQRVSSLLIACNLMPEGTMHSVFYADASKTTGTLDLGPRGIGFSPNLCKILQDIPEWIVYVPDSQCSYQSSCMMITKTIGCYMGPLGNVPLLPLPMGFCNAASPALHSVEGSP